MRKHRAAGVFLAVVLSAATGLAQNRGAVTVVANVRPSVLFSGTTPASTTFVQGGDQSASVTITVLPASEPQALTTRAVVANNPRSTGYELGGKLAGPGMVTVDGIALSRGGTVIAPLAPYGISQEHLIVVSGPSAVSIVVTCRPK